MRQTTSHPVITERSNYLLIRPVGRPQKIKINLDRILFLEADGMECKIWLSQQTQYTVAKPLINLLQYLPKAYFKRCHRSYAVNISHITYIGIHTIQIQGIDILIPIGDRKIHYDFDHWEQTNSL